MSWFILFVAGLLEAGWLVGIVQSQSFTKWPYVLMAVCSMVLSLLLFSLAVKDIPVHLAYIVWLAVGAASITLINHFFFAQAISAAQAFFLTVIIAGVAGLKVYS